MSIGIKHLLGSSATLVLLLTVILWVDAPRRSTWFRIRFDHISVDAHSHMHGVGASVHLMDDSHELKLEGDRFDPRPWEWTAYAALYQVSGYGFAAEFMHRQDFDPVGRATSLSVPHWFLFVVFALPTLLYIRFLYRRRRRRAVHSPKI